MFVIDVNPIDGTEPFPKGVGRGDLMPTHAPRPQQARRLADEAEHIDRDLGQEIAQQVVSHTLDQNARYARPWLWWGCGRRRSGVCGESWSRSLCAGATNMRGKPRAPLPCTLARSRCLAHRRPRCCLPLTPQSALSIWRSVLLNLYCATCTPNFGL